MNNAQYALDHLVAHGIARDYVRDNYGIDAAFKWEHDANGQHWLIAKRGGREHRAGPITKLKLQRNPDQVDNAVEALLRSCGLALKED